MTPNVISVSPHPDDELLGAPATLMALRDAGWRVVNLACGLGHAADHDRRRAELVEACRRARFELRIAPDGSERALADQLAALAKELGATLIVGPSPHDGHPAHELVGRAIRDAVERAHDGQVLFWGLWSELPIANVLLPFDGARLAEIQQALRAHSGELTRNGFDRLLGARAGASAVLGPERVFGFGSPGIEARYAELMCDARWRDGAWRLALPRVFDPLAPAAGDVGPELGWWLHEPSVRARLGAYSSAR